MPGVRIDWTYDGVLPELTVTRDGEVLVYLPGDTRLYLDGAGTDASVYRVTSADLVLDTGPFQPRVNRGAQLQARRRVDHNWGAADALRFVDDGGLGINALTVRVYFEPDWLAERTALALCITETLSDGRWRDFFLLEPGFTYVLHVAGNGFGPVVTTLVV